MNKTLFLFIDESGHHGLKKIQQEFPVFLLCVCVFDKNYYQTEFIRLMEEIKIKYFPNKNIILHSRDIRKWQKDFNDAKKAGYELRSERRARGWAARKRAGWTPKPAQTQEGAPW